MFYRDYLQAQRRLLAQARDRALFDLRVADNTYETVEESFQLKALMAGLTPDRRPEGTVASSKKNHVATQSDFCARHPKTWNGVTPKAECSPSHSQDW